LGRAGRQALQPRAPPAAWQWPVARRKAACDPAVATRLACILPAAPRRDTVL